LKFRIEISSVLLIILSFLQGCTKSEDNYDLSGHIQYNKSQSCDLSGRELRDPFNIDNIRKAYENLKTTGSAVPDINIEPNYIYLRFLPANEDEMEMLKSDSSLVLYDYPLNYEPAEEGEISAGVATITSPQYCVVPAEKALPAINYEIIYKVFLPPDENQITKSTSDTLNNFFQDLVYESAKLTGNLDGDETKFTKSTMGNRWTPKGRIRVWDDLIGDYIPLNHVNVHARWFTHVETALTDENGNFTMKSFRYKVNYSIKWENSLFSIRDGKFFQAWYNGPKLKGDWNLDIKGGKSMMYATIHRAAYRQFYGDNLGLQRPALKYGGRTKISYRDGDGTGVFNGDWSAGGILPDIEICGKSDGYYRPTNQVYGSTIHELGHQAHSQLVGNIKFYQTSNIIRESWAEAVEWALTNEEYNKLGLKYGNQVAIKYNHQSGSHNSWPYVDDKNYSPIFIDLMDTVNQRNLYGPEYPEDLISQYSLVYLEHNVMVSIVDIPSLRDEISRHKLEGVDDYKINELFLLY
jgi:hypothetical protein